MDDLTQIVPGKPEFYRDAAGLIYESSHELFQFMFPCRAVAETVIGKLYRMEKGYFSYRFSTVIRRNEKIVGLQLGYDLKQLLSQELAGSLSLLIKSPVRNWWHIIGKVGPVLEQYVPKPTEGAYYINNIAVSTTTRGAGIGTNLLNDILNKAKQKGYHCVQLDVTAVNNKAIKFYETHGFFRVSDSGSEKLHKQYGLPPLIRMTHKFHSSLENISDEGQKDNPLIVTDVTQLYPTKVIATFAPSTVEQLQEFLSGTSTPISIGGGRFSMGGQIASENSVHIDMRGLNRVVEFNPSESWIRVQGGIRWHQIQSLIDEYGLAIKIMQTYADFTVGGSISVNCHGRYIGLGPIVLSIRKLKVMLHDGELIETSADIQPEIFYSVAGGYGAIGIIIEAELDLAKNTRVERIRKKLDTRDYLQYFRTQIREDSNTVFHNADLYPPMYKSASAVTWRTTHKQVTTKTQLNPNRKWYLLEKYFMWAITETPFGKWRREKIIDPIIYSKSKVHWRNYEAGYRVSELEPVFRDERTYVLQEYFIPIEQFLVFTEAMTDILNRFDVNVVNISVRHALVDPGSNLAWAKNESFAFVLYYKQRTSQSAKHCVAVWTRELIDAVISHGGVYYLPYQPHATLDQFQRAYPDSEKLFSIKRQYDPGYRFRNCLWNQYYQHSGTINPDTVYIKGNSEFLDVYQNVQQRDDFYRFLQNVYRIYPEDKFHALIIDACDKYSEDEVIYNYIKEQLPKIRPLLSDLKFALPALIKQKKVITHQTNQLLGGREINGYLEIGSTGRYVKSLCKTNNIRGPIYLTNDVIPDKSLPEIMERGQLKEVGTFFPLNNYEPISKSFISEQSLDLVTCYIGLHHCSPAKLDAYVSSIHRVLRNGGVFILRDHNADSEQMKNFASLVHTVFNAGLGVDWNTNQEEERYFDSVEHWVKVLEKHGFEDSGSRLLQDHDPSANTLMMFTRPSTTL